MKYAVGLSLALFVALTGCTAEFDGGVENCGERCDTIVEFPEITDAPEKVLFIPISSGYLGLSEREWQSDDNEFDRAINELTSFYSSRGVEVQSLRRVSTWEELAMELSVYEANSFDRLLIVGHGAYDGPLTRGNFSKNLGDGEFVETWNLQPGLTRVHNYTFSANSPVGDYLNDNSSWIFSSYDSVNDDLLGLIDDEVQIEYDNCVNDELRDLEYSCEVSCEAVCQHSGQEELYTNCYSGCYNQCLDENDGQAHETCNPLEASVEEYIDSDLFDNFVSSIARVVSEDGLIFLGHCNAATDVGDYQGAVALLSTSARNYTELISEYTGRYVAGPVGSTSGQDIIDRVSAMEQKIDQKYLFIAAPNK